MRGCCRSPLAFLSLLTTRAGAAERSAEGPTRSTERALTQERSGSLVDIGGRTGGMREWQGLVDTLESSSPQLSL